MLLSLITTIRIDDSSLDRISCVTSHALRRLRSRLGRLSHTLSQRDLILIGSVRTFVGIDFVFAILLDELSQVFDGARAGVDDWFLFTAGGEELDGGEALDLVGNVVGCGVYFCNGYLGRGGVHGCEFFVFGCQAEIRY